MLIFVHWCKQLHEYPSMNALNARTKVYEAQKPGLVSGFESTICHLQDLGLQLSEYG